MPFKLLLLKQQKKKNNNNIKILNRNLKPLLTQYIHRESLFEEVKFNFDLIACNVIPFDMSIVLYYGSVIKYGAPHNFKPCLSFWPAAL